MGIRMDQHFGLNAWAENYVEGKLEFSHKEQITKKYSDGKIEVGPEINIFKSDVKKVSSENWYSGTYGEQYPLHKYIFPNGDVLYEKVQSENWSSGPCFFLALCYEGGKWLEKSLWAQEDIDNA